MSEPALTLDQKTQIRAPLAYATDEGDKYYFEVPAPEADGRNIGSGTAKHEVTIFDARAWPERLTLDVHDHLAPDEAIFFKVYDSATDGRARYTLHTAFELPDPDPDAAPRHSVEMRLFAFY